MAKYHKSEIIKRPIEKFGTNVKKTAWSSILESLSILVLGILFIIWPDTMIQLIAYIIGAIFLVKGLIDIMVYFMDQKNAYSNLLLSGLIAACIGLAALVAGPNIADIFRIIIGIFLIYEALVRVSGAVKLYYVIDPACLAHINGNPSMVSSSRIPHLKTRCNALGAQHGAHYRRIVKADACLIV